MPACYLSSREILVPETRFPRIGNARNLLSYAPNGMGLPLGTGLHEVFMRKNGEIALARRLGDIVCRKPGA
jgi:hypothetical protein